MAFRIPIKLLTEHQIAKIKRELTLKEKKSYIQTKHNFSGEEIDFFLVDETEEEILLPMYYASTLLNTPIINKNKVYSPVQPFFMKDPPRDYQVEVIQKSLHNFSRRGTTFLNVFCSYGKTWVSGFLSSVLSKECGIATLITCHLSVIFDSWVGTFKNQSNAKIHIVGKDNDEQPDPNTQIFVCMDTNLSTISKEISSRVGHLIVDEADCYCTQRRGYGLLSLEPRFITVLTATYERDDGFNSMLDLLVGKDKITKISNKPFFVFKYITPYTPESESGAYGVKIDTILKSLDGMEPRNSQILQIVLDNPNEKILILTKHVDHAKKLTVWLDHYFDKFKTGQTVSLLAGKIKKYNDASVIVGTISKAGRGYDEKEACRDWGGVRINMLVLASSTRKIEQIAGRVFRSEFPVIIDFVDNHKNLKNHWNDRRKWYESRNGIIYPFKERFCWADVQGKIIQNYFNSTENVSQDDDTNLDKAASLRKNHLKQIMCAK